MSRDFPDALPKRFGAVGRLEGFFVGLKHCSMGDQLDGEPVPLIVRELLSNVVFVRRESGGVLQDSVGEDSSLDDERELMACVEASPATCR